MFIKPYILFTVVVEYHCNSLLEMEIPNYLNHTKYSYSTSINLLTAVIYLWTAVGNEVIRLDSLSSTSFTGLWATFGVVHLPFFSTNTLILGRLCVRHIY